MSSGNSPLPRKKKASPDGAIVITGISGNFGRLLTQRLHPDCSIIGIDQRPFDDKPKDVLHYQVDVRRRKAEDIFRSKNVRALIHLGLVHRTQPGSQHYRDMNVLGTIKLLDYCRQYRIPKVVLVSTGYVYGPQPANDNFLAEDSPLLGALDYPEMSALIEWDMYAQSFFWKHPDIETVILRPVHVVGPHVRNAPSNYLRLPNPPTVFGFDPMLQLVHEQDFVQAILLGLEAGRRGVFNIVGQGEVPLSTILAELGKTSIPIPHLLAKAAIKRLWKWNLTAFPPGELPHLMYQCMLDGTRAKEVLGYRPSYSLKQTIRSVLP